MSDVEDTVWVPYSRSAISNVCKMIELNLPTEINLYDLIYDACHIYTWTNVPHLYIHGLMCHIMHGQMCHTHTWPTVPHPYMAKCATPLHGQMCHIHTWPNMPYPYMAKCATPIHGQMCHTHKWLILHHLV